MWSPGEFCRNCWVGMLDYTKPGCYSILDYAPKIPIKLIRFPPNDTQEPNSHISILDSRQNCACLETIPFTAASTQGLAYLHNPYMGAATLLPPARLLYTVYIKNLSNDVKWLYILYMMETQIRRLTPFIISIMKSLVIPAISSVIYSRITLFFALNKVSRGDWL